VGKGRGTETLRPFFKRPGRSGARVQTVASDMAGGYVKVSSAFTLPRMQSRVQKRLSRLNGSA